MAVVLCVQWCDGWCWAVLLQVCAVCQDPDSLEGNEIIYCDGCDMAVHWVRTSWGRVCGVNLTFLWSYQSCYQMEALPKEDKWLCEPCKVSRPPALSTHRPLFQCFASPRWAQAGVNTKRLKCELCPAITKKPGAFRRMNAGGWAHVVCAIWIPETVFDGDNRINDNLVDKRRAHLKCSVCDQRDVGPCVQCSWVRCAVPFHPMCGLQDGE